MNNDSINLLKFEIKNILTNYLNNNTLNEIDNKKLFQFIYNDFVYGSIDYEITNLLKSYFILNNLNNNYILNNEKLSNNLNNTNNNCMLNNEETCGNLNNTNNNYMLNNEEPCSNLNSIGDLKKQENLSDLILKTYSDNKVKQQIITKRRYLY